METLTTITQEQAFKIAAMDYNKDIQFIISTHDCVATLFVVGYEGSWDLCIGSFVIKDLSIFGRLPNVDFG